MYESVPQKLGHTNRFTEVKALNTNNKSAATHNFPQSLANGLEVKLQQGLEIHGLKECGPWRCTVFNWFPKHLRYTDFGQKP